MSGFQATILHLESPVENVERTLVVSYHEDSRAAFTRHFGEQLHHLPPTMAGVLFAKVFMRRFQATFSYVIWGKEFYGQQRHS